MEGYDKYLYESLQIIKRSPDIDDGQLSLVLIDSGIPKELVNFFLAFIPMAFTRIIFSNLNVNFTKEYIIHHKSGVEECGVLTENEHFLKVWDCCAKIISEGVDRDAIINLAGRSSEFKIINEFLLKGVDVGEVKFTPVHVFL